MVALGRGAVLPLLAARLRRRDEALRPHPAAARRARRRRSPRSLLAWILFDPGADASRVYYGTDTHAVGLLAGVALALVWSPIELRRRRTGPLVGPILDVVGVLALAYIVLSFVHVHDYDLALWHGGYLWLALVTALLLAVLAHPAARLGGMLGQAPVLWLGLRSYSFYLWHWPVLALTRPGVDVNLPNGVLIPLQLALVCLLAELSYRFVELPFRGKAKLPSLPDGLAAAWRGRRSSSASLAVVALVGWSGIVAAARAPQPPPRPPRPRPGPVPPTKAERRRPPATEAGRAQAAGARSAAAAAGQPLPPASAPAADPRPRRLGDDRRQGQPRGPARPRLLDERQGRPPGGRIRRDPRSGCSAKGTTPTR